MTSAKDYEILISSISHEIRNPVTLINSYLQLMADQHPQIRSYTQWQPIQSEMAYLCRLLTDISAFNNSMRLICTAVDMNQWLAEYAAAAQMMVTSLANSCCSSASRTFAAPKFLYLPAENLPDASIDPVKLRQVLDNLIRNAVEAICSPLPDGKTKAADRAETITLCAALKDSRLCITVSDTGCGIPPEHIGSIFQPFITHKTDSSGLGLAVCKRIIEAHGGSISVRSSHNTGTAFTVLLPVCGITAEPEESPR